MKLIVFLLLASTALLTITVNAQDQSNRFMEQHHSKFVKKHLEQTKGMLLKAMENDDPHMQTTAIQTLRELEIIFQDDKFSSFIEPLINNVKDEKEDTQVRLISALALENLHSDIGDAAIYDVAQNTSNKSVKDLCVVMSLQSFKNEDDLKEKPAAIYK
jgi:hypothetical protein